MRNRGLDAVTLGVIGLGYVGLPLAVEFGKCLPVLGFDINASRIDELRRGEDHTLEVSPDELRGSLHLSYSRDAEDLRGCNVYIVTVSTPIDDNKRLDVASVLGASRFPAGQADGRL